MAIKIVYSGHGGFSGYKYGQVNLEIKAYQDNLKKLGYYIDPSEYEDGIFGRNTVSQTRMLQSQANLPITGEADDATIAKAKELTSGVKQRPLYEETVKPYVATKISQKETKYVSEVKKRVTSPVIPISAKKTVTTTQIEPSTTLFTSFNIGIGLASIGLVFYLLHLRASKTI